MENLLEARYLEIDKLEDNKAIGVDRASPVILKRCNATVIIIFQSSPKVLIRFSGS